MRLFGEKRRSKRLPEICLVRYKKPGVREIGEGELANVRDISLGGISLRTHEVLLVSTPLQLTINLPLSKGPISAEGEVRQCKKVHGTQIFRVGIEFKNMSDHDRKELEKYLGHIRRK
jgi:c-di-GMP-binding flagellar brake protein YcgR